jgi:hypothetical protein
MFTQKVPLDWAEKVSAIDVIPVQGHFSVEPRWSAR